MASPVTVPHKKLTAASTTVHFRPWRRNRNSPLPICYFTG